MVKKPRIQTLEVLRGIAFVAVMFSHTGVYKFGCLGKWGVSIFLILCGFVAIYSQYDLEIVPSFKNNFMYAINKIKKLYLLHVITTLSLVIFNFIGVDREPISIILIRLLLNLLLVQEWVPLYHCNYNGPSWYLCALFLFYLVFPLILKVIKKYKTIKRANITIIFLFAIQIIIGIIASKIPIQQYYEGILFTNDAPLWIVYNHPLTRLIDLLIGCNLGYIFIYTQKNTIKNATKKEFLSILLVIACLIIYIVSNQNQQIVLNVPVPKPNLWWIHVVLFTPSSILIIYLFAFGQGKITKALVNKPIMYLAKISSYGFLIHMVVFRYLESIIAYLFGRYDYYTYALYFIFFKSTFGILISIFCCELWIRLCDFCKKKYSSHLNSAGKI